MYSILEVVWMLGIKIEDDDNHRTLLCKISLINILWYVHILSYSSSWSYWYHNVLKCYYSDGSEPGQVRLYYSYGLHSHFYGRVEVFLSETWGRVTGLWTRANAEVVCHQLGYDIPSELTFTNENNYYGLHTFTYYIFFMRSLFFHKKFHCSSHMHQQPSVHRMKDTLNDKVLPLLSTTCKTPISLYTLV